MDLPTYTNIWRIEKRLYKLYDLRLPMPLPLVQIGVFVGVFLPWILLLQLVGVPFKTPWHVLYLVPPGVLTWMATRPVIEGKRLTELILSQSRYLSEPRTWCRLTPIREPSEVRVVARVWRRADHAVPEAAAAVRATRRARRKARAERGSGRGRVVEAPVRTAAARTAGAALTEAASRAHPVPPQPAGPAGDAVYAARPRPAAEPATEVVARYERVRSVERAHPAVPGQGSTGAGVSAASPAHPAAPTGTTRPAESGGRRAARPWRVTTGRDISHEPEFPPPPVPLPPGAAGPTVPGREPALAPPGDELERPPATPALEVPPDREQVPGSGKRALASGVLRPGNEAEFWKAISSETTARNAPTQDAEAQDGSRAVRDGGARETTATPDIHPVSGTAAPSNVDTPPNVDAPPGTASLPETTPSGVALPGGDASGQAVPAVPGAFGAASQVFAVPPVSEGHDVGRPGSSDAEGNRGTGVDEPERGREREPGLDNVPGNTGEHDDLDERANVDEPVPGNGCETRAEDGRVKGPEGAVKDQPVNTAETVDTEKTEKTEKTADTGHTENTGQGGPVKEPSSTSVREPIREPTVKPPSKPWSTELSRPRQGGADSLIWPPAAAAPGSPGRPPALPARSGPGRPVKPPPPRVVPEPRGAEPPSWEPTAHPTGQGDDRHTGPARQAGSAPPPPRDVRSGPASPVRPRPLPHPAPPPPPGPAIAPPDPEQEPPAGGGLRRLLKAVGGGHSDGGSEWEERLQRPFQGTRHIVVLGCTGGAGQTVTALMLGHTFAHHGSEPAVAIDVNPGPGALARRTRSETNETLTGLITRAERISSLTAMRRYTSRARSGLDVIAAGKNPLHALDDRDYALAIRTIDRFYSVTLLDTAASVVARVLPYADQLVLVAPASSDAPRAVAMTFEWLDGHGYDDLRAHAVTVINGVSRRSMDDVEQAEAVARGRCRALVRIPWDDHLSLDRSPRNELKSLRAPTRRAYLALAGVVAGGFGELPERYREQEQEASR